MLDAAAIAPTVTWGTSPPDALPITGHVPDPAHGADPEFLMSDSIHIQIRDHGNGIPEEYQQHIFEPFFSTKEAGHGTGLGLFITAEIVREHKGRIEVESVEGRGSTFRIVFPALGKDA